MANIFIFLFLGTLGWGISLYLIKILLLSLSPVEIVLYRSLIGAASLFVLSRILGIRLKNMKSIVIDGVVLGIFNMALPLYLISLAESYVTSSLAAVLNGLTPLSTFLLSYIFYDKAPRLNRYHLLSIFLGFLGIILVNYDAAMHSVSLIYVLALGVASVSYSFAANYIQIYSKSENTVLVSAIASLFTALMMAMYKLPYQGYLYWGYPENIQQIMSLLWLGVVGTGISLYLYCLLIQRAGSLMGIMVTYLMTITGVLMGVFLLNETLSTLAIMGSICIVASLLVINHYQHFEARKYVHKQAHGFVGES